MRRYSAHRDSGVEWLGEVPEGWGVKKFRFLFEESVEKIESEVVGVMLSVSGYRGIEIKEYDDENRRRTDEDLEGYRIVRPGQLVVNTMWLNYAGLGVSAHEGHVSPAYRSYNFRGGQDRRYTHHLMRSSVYVLAYTQLLTGVRPNSLQMSRNDLMDFPVLLPPLPEQRAIAAFLDRETAKIDALVAEQRRLIDLLREKRQAVISHAVTRGLNPSAPLKPSGVDWLGDVPEGWEVGPLKRYGVFGAGAGFPHEEQGVEGEDLPFFKVNAIGKALRGDRLIADVDTISAETADRLRAKIFAEGTIVFAKIGAAMLLGRIRVLPCPACMDNNMMGFTVSEPNSLEYFRHLLTLVRFDLIANPGTVPSLNEGQIANLQVCVPPVLNRAGFAGDQIVRITRPYRVCSSLHRRPPLPQPVVCFR